MVAIPCWAVAVFVVPGLRALTNYLFILPLLWLEIMILVESYINKKAQRRAIELEDMEREHNKRKYGDRF